MAITEQKIKDLEDKGFDVLYDDKETEWLAMVSAARQFAKDNITGGKEPRPDDVAQALLPMLRVHDSLRGHQEDHRARGKRYAEWFCEYIIDKAG
jgi:hypothetical protein